MTNEASTNRRLASNVDHYSASSRNSAGTAWSATFPCPGRLKFQPADVRLEKANKAIEARGIEPDGYGWAKLIEEVFAKDHRELADELHFGDTEIDSCVVWVESESTCKTLIEVTWSLIQVS